MRVDRSISPVIFLIIGIALGTIFTWHQFFSVPEHFPVNSSFTVNENEGLSSISKRLYREGYISSPLLFRLGLSFLGKDKAIQLGGYSFSEPVNLLKVVHMFVEGKPKSPLLSVTIPEGSTSFEVAVIVAKALPGISVDIFGEIISKYEADGKLFPSTYFLLPSYKEKEVVELMLNTFSKKITPILTKAEFPSPLTTEKEVLTLASILEGEAKTEEDMRIIAGILLQRLRIGMPLQVDVAKETYTTKGLPFMPINNPGVVAVDAVLHPVETSYLYYITGNDGKMYYARTFNEHRHNILKYLK
jgi:UPF0755 protein